MHQPLANDSPASASPSPSASPEEHTPSAFDRFWAAYPKKVGKDAARSAFTKRRPTEALLDQMLSALERQRQSHDWRKEGGRFIPNPSTWLHQGRWQDEIGATAALVSSKTQTNLANQAEAVKLIERGAFGDC